MINIYMFKIQNYLYIKLNLKETKKTKKKLYLTKTFKYCV